MTDHEDKAAARFAPGFTGSGWVAARDAASVLSVPGPVGPDLFGEIAAFCREIPAGGAVAGYIGYEAAAALYPDLDFPASPDGLPLVHLVKYRRMDPCGPPAASGGYRPAASITRPGQADFVANVEAVIAAIRDGAIFQANISRRLSAEIDGAPDTALGLFARMISAAPAPYAAFIPVPGGAVLSNSPELFLSVDGQHVAAEPIKGTAPRYDDPDADRAAALALHNSEKDRAENIMIADLLRNDLAKVCADHSIREAAICELRSLPAVHHLYSRIEGSLREGMGPIDALAAAFPCGSVTGAPKHRALQVITMLEGEGRGPYCGAAVYVPADGPAVFSVAIRTAALRFGDGTATLDYRAGGGITVLSDPQEEYDETEDKAYGFEAMLT